jgi:membrane protease YdiL (CAAX protease family)
MFTPLVSVLLMQWVVTRDGYSRQGWKVLGIDRLGVRGWAMAILLPLFIMSVTYGIVWGTGIGRINLAGTEGQIELLSILQTLVGLIVGFALFEEIGWRGYLLPNLLSLGRTRAMLVSGLLHGVYHLPLMLMTPYYHGSGNRYIVVTLFLLTMVGAGVCYGYLRLTTQSFWPATIAHNAFNTIWETYSSITVAVASPLLLEYLAGESGILTLIGVSFAAVWLIKRLNRQEQPQQSAPVLATSH